MKLASLILFEPTLVKALVGLLGTGFFFVPNFLKIVRFSACGAGFVAFEIVALFFALVAGTGARVASVSNVGFVSALLFGT